jgi:hypothetical protein
MKHHRVWLQVVARRSMTAANVASSRRMLRSHIQCTVRTPAVSSASSSVLFRQKQQRWMSDETEKKEEGDGTETIHIKFCYSKYDVEEVTSFDPDMPDIVTAKCNLQDIRKEAAEWFDGSTNLEYYVGSEWKPLDNLQDLESFKRSNMPIHIRDPTTFHDEDYDGDGNDNNADENDEMQETIERLVGTLKGSGHVRVSNDTLKVGNSSHETVPTREWVLAQAASDTALRDLLLSHVCGLDHIVQCLHFDILWEADNSEETTRETVNHASTTEEAIKESV